MTPNINSVINPSKNYIREEDPASNITKMVALQELRLAKKVSLELIRDCPKQIHSDLKEAFDKAISRLT